MTSRRAASFLALLIAVGTSANAAVRVDPLTPLLNEVVQVPAGNSLAFPLTLPSGTSLLVSIGVKGSNRSLDIALLSDTEFGKFEAGQEARAEEGTDQALGTSCQTTPVPEAHPGA